MYPIPITFIPLCYSNTIVSYEDGHFLMICSCSCSSYCQLSQAWRTRFPGLKLRALVSSASQFSMRQLFDSGRGPRCHIQWISHTLGVGLRIYCGASSLYTSNQIIYEWKLHLYMVMNYKTLKEMFQSHVTCVPLSHFHFGLQCQSCL